MNAYQKACFLVFLLLGYFSNAFSQLPNNISKTEKLYGLSKFWQEANYNFVYLNQVDRVMFDSTYKAMLGTITETKNDYEYYRELKKFCALLKDGHTNVYFPQGIEQMTTMFGEYRLFVEAIEGKAIIVRTNFSKKNEIPIGSEIIKVNGLSTQDYLEKFVKPYIASSTDAIRDLTAIHSVLTGIEGDEYEVTIRKPNKKETTLHLKHQTTKEAAVYPAFIENENKLLDFKWYDKGIAYLALNSFADEKIDTLFLQKLSELYKAKALIIDLRGNGGGSTKIGAAIFKYLTNDTLLYGSLTASRVHIPAHKAWGKFKEPKDTIRNAFNTQSYLTYRDSYFQNFDYGSEVNDVKAPKIVVPTVLLIGPGTASAAEDFLIYADKQSHMTKIGEPTFGSTGQPLLFEMPGGGMARICTKKDTYPDGRAFVGVGILPDITVVKNIKDYFKGTDSGLEAAIKFLNSKIKK